MELLEDSHAKLDPGRQYPQLQAILTLVRHWLADPDRASLRWLDLGCGQGQILLQLADATTRESRLKIVFHGIDAKREYLNRVRAVGASHHVQIVTHEGFLGRLDETLATEAAFDLVTCFNVFHELQPEDLRSMLVASVKRLAPGGLFFAYDVETLSPAELELGAVNWTLEEIRELLNVFSAALRIEGAFEVHPWYHSTTKAWDCQIDRRQLETAFDLIRTDEVRIRNDLHAKVRELVDRKFQLCRVQLESFTIAGSTTKAEAELKVRAVYDYWALSRARERLNR